MSDSAEKKRKLEVEGPKIGNKAKLRWNLLSSALIKKSSDDKSRKSSELEAKVEKEEENGFRYPSFGLLQVSKLENSTKDQLWWYHVTSQRFREIDLKVGLIRPVFTKGELTGFNNTGNVCVWPAEECLATFCLESKHLINDKDVIELGCGMTGLAGLIIYQACKPNSLMMTDGNQNSVNNMKSILKANNFDKEDKIQAVELLWETVDQNLENSFDTVICGDCIFFKEFQHDLVECIHKLLRNDGIAILTAPKRGISLDNFVKLATLKFDVKVRENYSVFISKRKSELLLEDRFEENQHYPMLLEMRKKSNISHL